MLFISEKLSPDLINVSKENIPFSFFDNIQGFAEFTVDLFGT